MQPAASHPVGRGAAHFSAGPPAVPAGQYCGDVLPQREGLLGKTLVPGVPPGSRFFNPLLRRGPSHPFPSQSRGEVRERLLSATRSSEGQPAVLGILGDTGGVSVLAG